MPFEHHTGSSGGLEPARRIMVRTRRRRICMSRIDLTKIPSKLIAAEDITKASCKR
jgi:hypothetical protein